MASSWPVRDCHSALPISSRYSGQTGLAVDASGSTVLRRLLCVSPLRSFRAFGFGILPLPMLVSSVRAKESETNSERASGCAAAVQGINLTKQGASMNKRRLIAEIASVDGAVIFDTGGVVAFGAVIKPHNSVSSETGARTTAAKSAYRHGGIPLKISSDGQASVYFQSSDGDKECEATLEFL